MWRNIQIPSRSRGTSTSRIQSENCGKSSEGTVHVNPPAPWELMEEDVQMPYDCGRVFQPSRHCVKPTENKPLVCLDTCNMRMAQFNIPKVDHTPQMLLASLSHVNPTMKQRSSSLNAPKRQPVHNSQRPTNTPQDPPPTKTMQSNSCKSSWTGNPNQYLTQSLFTPCRTSPPPLSWHFRRQCSVGPDNSNNHSSTKATSDTSSSSDSNASSYKEQSPVYVYVVNDSE